MTFELNDEDFRHLMIALGMGVGFAQESKALKPEVIDGILRVAADLMRQGRRERSESV